MSSEIPSDRSRRVLSSGIPAVINATGHCVVFIVPREQCFRRPFVFLFARRAAWRPSIFAHGDSSAVRRLNPWSRRRRAPARTVSRRRSTSPAPASASGPASSPSTVPGCCCWWRDSAPPLRNENNRHYTSLHYVIAISSLLSVPIDLSIYLSFSVVQLNVQFFCRALSKHAVNHWSRLKKNANEINDRLYCSALFSRLFSGGFRVPVVQKRRKNNKETRGKKKKRRKKEMCRMQIETL